MQTQMPNEDVSEQCRIEANTLLVQDCILLEEKSTSDLIPCGKNQPDHFNALRAPGFLHRGISGRHPTRTTTTLHRLSCSCYLVVKSVQAWRISTTVSLLKETDLVPLVATDRAGWGPLEGTYNRWWTVRGVEPAAFLWFNYWVNISHLPCFYFAGGERGHKSNLGQP